MSVDGYLRTAPVRVRTSEPPSFGRDLLFAAASVAMISGVNLPLGNMPLFTLFAVAIFAVSARSILTSRSARNFLVPPLLSFLLVHLMFAFRVSTSNGLAFVLQALIVALFVVAFANRYSQIGMSQYLKLTGMGMVGLLVFVVGYHISEHIYTSYKLLDDPKAVFNLLPLMLLVLRHSRAPAAKVLFPLLLPLFVVVMLLSGERKAYILLALFTPLLINLRSLSTYILPVVLALAVSAGLSLDRSGYVKRQVNTLSLLAEGSTSKTISDNARSWAIEHAADIFVEHPIIGVGTNGYGATVTASSNENKAPHNEWLRIAADNGMVGLFFFSATLIWGFVGLFRTRVGRRVRTRNEKLIAFALFATLLLYLSFEAFDFIVLTAFALTSLLQFLRLDPNDGLPTTRSLRPELTQVPAQARTLNTAFSTSDSGSSDQSLRARRCEH